MPKTLSSAPTAVKKVLRLSFNDVIHACVQFDNCQLSEQLFVEVTNMYSFVGLMYILACSLSVGLRLYLSASLITSIF